MYDKAVASVDRTCTAVARMRSTSGSASVTGGVIGNVGIISEVLAVDSGNNGSWLLLPLKLRKKSASEGKVFIMLGSSQMLSQGTGKTGGGKDWWGKGVKRDLSRM